MYHFYSSIYSSILLFFLLASVVSFVLLTLSTSLASQNYRGEKLSSYECGFDPFHDSRQIFDVRFYLVGILFLLFDVEATFLFPWAVTLSQNQAFGFWTIVDFLFELFIGFVYLWNLGCLDSISLKN